MNISVNNCGSWLNRGILNGSSYLFRPRWPTMLKKYLYTSVLLFTMFVIGFACQKTAQLLHLPLDLEANKGAGQILLYVIVIGCILWFTKNIWKHDVRASMALYMANRKRILRGFGICAGISLALQVPIYALLFRAGILHISDYARHKNLGVLIFNIVISQIVMVVLATSEEGIFRAFLFSYLRGDTGKRNIVFAVIVSSIVFALSHEFHTLNHWLEPAYYGKLFGLLLLGILLAVTYQSTRSLACSIGVHTSLLWLDEVRRQTMDLHQPYWWTGTNNDLRTAPFVWLIFLILTVGFALAGNRLRPRVEIERDPHVPTDLMPDPLPQPSNSPAVSAPSYKTASPAK